MKHSDHSNLFIRQESFVVRARQEQAVQLGDVLDAYEQASRSKIFASGC